MKKILLSLVFVSLFILKGLGQQLFVPDGFTESGIGYSSNSNVGIGTENPQWGLLQINTSSDNTIGLRLQMGSFSMGGNSKFGIDAPGVSGGRFVVLPNGYVGIGGTGIPNYKLDVAGDINFTGNLYKNGQPFSGGGSSLWSQPGYDISSNGDVLIPGDYKLKFGNRGVSTSGHFYIFSSATLYNTYADISQGSLYFRKANYGDNSGAILGIQSNKTVTINYWETYDNTVTDTKGHALAVNGGIMAHYFDVDGKINAQEVEVKPDVWQDIVFDKDYKLMSLIELENYINTHKHLPSVPSDAEVKEKGIKIGEMNAILLGKVEELTRYVIEQNKTIEALKTKVEILERK